MAVFRGALNLGISNGLTYFFRSNTTWICRGFVSVSRPFYKSRVDKETCDKVIEAADTVKKGTEEVVSEVRRVGQVLTDKFATAAGNMMADVAKKGLDKASRSAETQGGKDAADTAKSLADAFKKKIDSDD